MACGQVSSARRLPRAGYATALCAEIAHYRHHEVDIRNAEAISKIFAEYEGEVSLGNPHCCSTIPRLGCQRPRHGFHRQRQWHIGRAGGDKEICKGRGLHLHLDEQSVRRSPNHLPLIELETRWELDPTHEYAVNGIPETMSIDRTMHSLFGVSKVAADVLVQEYGRYFGMNTACFRGGCLTGPNHSGTQLHGFLAYLMKCAVTGNPYTIFGYKRKQVRDNIHSGDLIRAFHEFFKKPRSGEVYNIGGGRYSNCSMMEANRYLRRDHRASHSIQICGRESPRRPYLVDSRSFAIPGSLLRHGSRNTIYPESCKRYTN